MTKIHLNDRIDNYFDDYRDELMNENARIALVISSRKAQSSKELNIVKGEYLEVRIAMSVQFLFNFSKYISTQIVNDSKNWWKCINAKRQAGLVPNNYVKAILFESVRY